MERVRYLVAYDIRDDDRLRAVAHVVKGYGYRLQYSVFVCDLSFREVLALKSDLRQVMNQAVDSVALINLGDPATRGTDCFEFMGWRRYDLPDDEPFVF